MKKCTKCKLLKNKTEFYENKRSKDGLNYSCKTCFKLTVKKRADYLYSLKEKKINKTDDPLYFKKYNIKNKEIIKEKRKKYYNENKERLLLINKNYYNKNKKNINRHNAIKAKERVKNSDLLKLILRIRNLIRKSIKNKNYTKKSRTYFILGCDYVFFKEYIESQFTKDMNWNNIHLDHIKPISLAKNENEVIELNHYTNFQPLLSLDNLKKSNKIITKQLKLL